MPNIILLGTGLTLIVLLVSLTRKMATLGITMGGWTSYPPLSAMPQVEQGNPFFAQISTGLTILQIALTIALLFVVFMWGKQIKKTS